MESTRQQILGILRRRQATVDDLRKELGLAPATIRRHMDILARDGYIDVSQVRRRTGRPHYVFSLTETGEGLFPKHYVRLTNRLIEEIVALGPEETTGRSGVELADVVFERMAQRLARSIGPRVHGLGLAERLDSTVAALSDEGIAFDVERADDGYLLVGHGCPCPRIARPGGQACAHDQRLLSMLLNADVTYVEPASLGQEGYCAYRVRGRERAEAQGPISNDGLPGARPAV